MFSSFSIFSGLPPHMNRGGGGRMRRGWGIRWHIRRRAGKRGPVKTHKKTTRLLLMGLFILITILAMSYAYYRFDRRILPLVLASTDMKLKTTINNAIHTEVQAIILDRAAKAVDFYIQTPEPNGNGNVLAVNTVLVNDICNAAALAISERLSNMEPEPVSVPVGMALGLDTLASIGPRFTFTLSPTGNALVNYESRFEAVGINQVHFEVWLTVVSTIRIINPVQSSTVTVTREVSLVDTVISGLVPETYLNMDGSILPRNDP